MNMLDDGDDRITVTGSVDVRASTKGETVTEGADDSATGERFEEFQVEGENVVGRVRELIHEGNVRHIVILGDDGSTILDVPVSVGVIGAVLLPFWVAVGAVAAVATNCTIKVERRDEDDD